MLMENWLQHSVCVCDSICTNQNTHRPWVREREWVSVRGLMHGWIIPSSSSPLLSYRFHPFSLFSFSICFSFVTQTRNEVWNLFRRNEKFTVKRKTAENNEKIHSIIHFHFFSSSFHFSLLPRLPVWCYFCRIKFVSVSFSTWITSLNSRTARMRCQTQRFVHGVYTASVSHTRNYEQIWSWPPSAFCHKRK